jgi:hypothetical protein
MVWFTGHVKKNNLYALPVADAALGRCTKKAKRCYRETGASCSSTTSADVAGSWLNLKKLTGLDVQLEPGSILEKNAEDNTWKVTTEALAKRLRESDLELVEDGCWLKVLPKTG